MKKSNFSYEVLLIDDGSKDNSWKIIEDINKKNKNIKGIKFRRNYGKSAALNIGFAKAKGDPDKLRPARPELLRTSDHGQRGRPPTSCAAAAAGCHAHADLGLVTLAPRATVPALLGWRMECLAWHDLEAETPVSSKAASHINVACHRSQTG